MDVLCTDKTGTLTEGVVRLEGRYDPNGEAAAPAPLRAGRAQRALRDRAREPARRRDLSAAAGPVDPALRASSTKSLTTSRESGCRSWSATGERCRLLTKGVAAHRCSTCAPASPGEAGRSTTRCAPSSPLSVSTIGAIRAFRVLGVATREIDAREVLRTRGRARAHVPRLPHSSSIRRRPMSRRHVADLARLGVGGSRSSPATTARWRCTSLAPWASR
jgi:Mg2+-importing ATPase